MNNNFITHFSVIEDPRIDRCKKHQLIDILFLSVCAVMSGAEGWEDIEDFGLAKLDWLQPIFRTNFKNKSADSFHLSNQ